MKQLIQFLHPGKEHTKESGIKWNTGAHRRKYIQSKGNYLTKDSKEPEFNQLFFWGEWEPQSTLVKTINSGQKDFPKNVFAPYYSSSSETTNTDPFVFGNEFLYFICKQGHYPSLRNIPIGSVILFGANLNENFVLDTVFVVKSFEEYNLNKIDELKNRYNSVFFDTALTPLREKKCVKKKEITEKPDGSCVPTQCNDDEKDDHHPTIEFSTYRIYKAAMYEDREQFNGIYSYVPCLAGNNGEQGFSRPTIKMDGIISESQKQGIKISKSNDIKNYWEQVKTQVLNNDQGLSLMINCELPPLNP